MAELRVRDQRPVDQDGAADTCPQGDYGDDTRDAAPGAEPHFGQPGRVGIIDYRHQPAGCPREQVDGVQANPGMVDIGGRLDRTAPHHGRKGEANRPIDADLFEDLTNRRRHR